MSALTKSQIRKAGSTLRAFTRGEATASERDAAIETIAQYRATFAYPLLKVNNGLRGFLNTLKIDAEVSQRLKRMDTIIEKISTRETGLDLSRMGDIGGCRIVLTDDDLDDLARIHHWIRYRWGEQITRESDYVEYPRSSGYRAIHLVVRRDERLIEVQLRTQRMHAWAQLIEALSQSLGTNYKQDADESAVHDFGRSLSKIHQSMDGRYALTPEDKAEFTYWSERVADMLTSHEINDEEV
ncbi:MAG: RelA/SpoT domain-containing protein [Schaalia hyovaginalis]|uniref:RelA/SpoT domain-containing protein n=1 Tax=Schaalia hyovaginalis TaxID=29316 RepID=UPI002A913102|nr:RelA/SpoT domain-containing protein [Schaalia hyovaginalis]MDY6213584.1 RelA/SpoT domain-containing protein [Schaalia hyovaginalis]